MNSVVVMTCVHAFRGVKNICWWKNLVAQSFFFCLFFGSRRCCHALFMLTVQWWWHNELSLWMGLTTMQQSHWNKVFVDSSLSSVLVSFFLFFFPPGYISGWPASTGIRKTGGFQFSRSFSIIFSNCHPAGYPGHCWTEGGHPGSGEYWELVRGQNFALISTMCDYNYLYWLFLLFLNCYTSTVHIWPVLRFSFWKCLLVQ